MLHDIRIRNYRSFQHFSVGDLAPVNLIVGENNSGKSSLLEAIYLLVGQNEPGRLLDIFDFRGETIERFGVRRPLTELLQRTLGYQVTHIFNGHVPDEQHPIEFESHGDRHMSLSIHAQPARDPKPMLRVGNAQVLATRVLVFDYSDGIDISIPVGADDTIDDRDFPAASAGVSASRFLTTDAPNFDQLADLWDSITLTPREDDVVNALRLLDSNVERISFTSRKTANSGILVKMSNQREPVPLGTMGDGMRRILALVANAVIAQDGVLLVDEIDTGLYYDVQRSMWRLLFDISQRLNVQIFATTHSLDCVQAFDQALRSSEGHIHGKLFRMGTRGERIEAITYTANELAIAMRQDIEVR